MLAAHYSEKAKAFIKTVICFDDEPADAEGNQSPPRTAKRAVSGFDDSELERPAHDNNIEQQDVSVEELHPLDFRATANAFAEKSILCSVLKPDQSGISLIERITTLANSADVTILDWELEGRKGGSEACRAAIDRILKQDRTEGGRLRLIVVFTGTDGQRAIDDLADKLADLKPNRPKNECALTGKHWRVVVFQKPHTTNPTAKLVTYSELPGNVVAEFAKLTNGLLPSAVLHGITAIRENTHRLLAVFDHDLDGAFLTHRALIPDPEDAEEFLLGLLQEEIGALLRYTNLRSCVDAAMCKKWIEANGILVEEKNKNKRERLVKAVSKPCLTKTQGFIKDFFEDEERQKEAPTARLVADKVLSAFYLANSDCADNGERRFSELSSYYGVGTRPNADNLWLRLGVIVRDESDSRYLMCLQPLCDSVRVKKGALFPFLILDSLPTNDMRMRKDLLVRSPAGESLWLQVDPSPKKLISFKFDPSEKGGVAPVGAIEESGRPVFETADPNGSRKLIWIRDVKLGKAQRFASGLAARFHTLGIDEFEWQRLHQLSAEVLT